MRRARSWRITQIMSASGGITKSSKEAWTRTRRVISATDDKDRDRKEGRKGDFFGALCGSSRLKRASEQRRGGVAFTVACCPPSAAAICLPLSHPLAWTPLGFEVVKLGFVPDIENKVLCSQSAVKLSRPISRPRHHVAFEFPTRSSTDGHLKLYRTSRIAHVRECKRGRTGFGNWYGNAIGGFACTY